jgi:hypothetical protein
LQFWYGGSANAVESALISMPKMSDVTTSAARSMTTPAERSLGGRKHKCADHLPQRIDAQAAAGLWRQRDRIFQKK